MWPTLHAAQSGSGTSLLRDYTAEQWDTCLIVFLHNTTDPMERVRVLVCAYVHQFVQHQVMWILSRRFTPCKYNTEATFLSLNMF